MEGLSRTLGVGPTIELGGRKLTVQSRILRHFAEIEAEIIKRRGNPFDLIREAKEALKECPEIMNQFVERAFDEARKWKTVTLLELGEFLNNTWGGTCFSLWLAIRDNDRTNLTLEYVTRQFSDEYEAQLRDFGAEAAQKWKSEIEAAIDQASGGDELGNSTGSPSSSDQTSPSESPTGTT